MPPRKRRGETSASSADATACGRAPGDVQPDNAVDAFVEGDGWYYAQCLAADADRVRVHFQGWPEADDCWLPRSEVIGDDLGRGAMTTIRHSFQNMARATSDNYDAWRAAASGRPAKRARGAAPPAARRAAKSAARPLSSGDSLAALPPPPAAKKARAAPRPEAAPAPAAAAPSPPVEAGGKTSRFTGVQWDAWSGKWKALVVVHGHNIPLGYFDVEEDAARAYDAARVKWQALISNSKRPPNFPGEPDEATLAALPPLPSQLQTPARLAPRRRSAPGPAPDARLGRWVEVYWTGDSAWYLGRVEGQRTGSTGGVELQVAYVDDETIYQALRTEPFAGDGAPPYVQGTQPDSWRFAEAPAATTKPAAKPRALKPATKPRAAAAKPATEDFDALVARDAPIERTEKARGGRTRSASIEAATTAREYFSRGGKKPDLKYDLKNGFFRVRAAGAPAADPSDEAEEEPVAKPRAAPAPAANKQRTAPLPKAAPRARPPRAARGTPDARIGQWVEVYWASEGAWYLGRVDSTRYSDGAGAIELRVDYTDDETHYQVFQDDAFAGAGDPPAQPDGAPERWRFATGPTPPSPKQQQGRWTPREEDDLCKVVAELGEAQWKAVAERLGTGRTAHGVEFRWGFLTGKNDGSKSTGQKPHAPRPVASPTAARKSRTPPKSAPAPRPQSPRTARSAPTTAPPPPGSRVAVRFADGKEYKGTVADALDKNRATVNYDDGQSEAVRFPDPDVRVMRVGSGWPLAPAAPGREARLTRRRGAEEEAQLTEAMNRSLVDASEAPPSPEAPPTPPSPAPRRPAIGALVDDAPAPARFKYVYPPKKAGGSWTTCVTLHGVSTSAGSHRTKTAAGRAIDAMLLAHGKPAVNFPGEEEASKAAFPGITTSGRVSRAKAPRRAAKAPQSRPKPRRAPKPAPRKTRTPSKYTGVHGAERQGAPTAWRTDVAVNGTTYHYEHATEREAAISYDAVRVMYRGEARLNFPERWPGDDSSRYAGVAWNADAVTTRAPWRAHHDSHELGSFDDEKVAARVYDFARRSKGQPIVNFDGSGEHGEMFCAYCEDWEIAAVAQKDEAPLVKKYGRRFFEDSEHPGEVYYVVHTGVQWRTDGMAMVKVDVVGPRDMSGAMPGPFVVGPCESTEVGENATMYMLNDALRSMIAATPQGLQVVAKEGDAPVPQLQLPEFVPEPFVEETRDPMAPLSPRRRPVVAPEAPEAPPASKPRRPPAPSAGQQRAAALDAEDAADGWTPPSKADSDARCLRACEACRAAGLGVRACLVDRRHAAGVAPRGFARFCDALRAAGVPFPDAPPAEGAVCAAVDAALSGVAVPTHFVDVVRGRRGYVPSACELRGTPRRRRATPMRLRWRASRAGSTTPSPRRSRSLPIGSRSSRPSSRAAAAPCTWTAATRGPSARSPTANNSTGDKYEPRSTRRRVGGRTPRSSWRRAGAPSRTGRRFCGRGATPCTSVRTCFVWWARRRRRCPTSTSSRTSARPSWR